MNASLPRRRFLSQVGRGMVLATVGLEVVRDLSLTGPLTAAESEPRLTFGPLEPLVSLMQETPADQLLPALVSQLKAGKDLRQLVAAAALANARTFGGEDYVGFHTLMALAPAYHMSQELPADRQALPVFKVLYRNTNRLQEFGGRSKEVLKPISVPASDPRPSESLLAGIKRKDLAGAEKTFAAWANRSTDEAFNHLLEAVQDQTEVHRVVLPYRAWDLLPVVGAEHAQTLLRQSIHYCLQAEGWRRPSQPDEPSTLLPRLFEEHHLADRALGKKEASDAWVLELSETFFKSTPAQAAAAAASALSEGFAPSAVGEAIALAANQLVLRDFGRTPDAESPGKPIGSVHGDSIGVHASDSANAWRNLARVSNNRNCFASLILGAYQVALDRAARGGDFLNWKPLPVPYHLDQVKSKEAPVLLRDLEEAIRGNMQARAAALVHRYGELGHPERAVFDLFLRYAISEDGALHAEKFYRTVSEEFSAARPAFRWRYLVGLARVTASEFGRPAPGMAQARELLKVG